MRIKYRLILTVIIIALIATVPLSYWILHRQKQVTLANIEKSGLANAKVLARSMNEVIVKNPQVPDLVSARLDGSDLINSFTNLFDLGLVYADVARISKNPELNGAVLATVYNHALAKTEAPNERLTYSAAEIKAFKYDISIGKTIREVECVNESGRCLEFLQMGTIDQGDKLLQLNIARMQFSKDFVLAPIETYEAIIFWATLSAIFIAVGIGHMMSQSLSNSIAKLAEGVEQYGSGELEHRVDIRSKDELGLLASTFNMMADDLRQKITEIQDANENLEKKVQNRTQDLETALEKVSALKTKQDADYFLCSLLIEPLAKLAGKSRYVKATQYVEQVKKNEFQGNTVQLGGDICVSGELYFRSQKNGVATAVRHIFVTNADAMGKSMQGGSGAIVYGTMINSILSRYSDNQIVTQSPEDWLTAIYWELHKVFKVFDSTMQMSCVCALINEETGEMTFFNAEHPLTVLYRSGRAEFIKNQAYSRKLGHNSPEVLFGLTKVRLQDEDVIFIGSDGKDDLSVMVDGEEIINWDEKEFLNRVTESKGNLEDVVKAIKHNGELIDDLSILRIEYIAPKLKHLQLEYKEDFRRIRVLVESGSYGAALEELGRLSTTNLPDFSPTYHELLGKAQAGNNQPEAAVASLLKSIEFGSNNHESHTVLGALFMQLEDYTAAMKHYKIALDLNPTDPTTRGNLEELRRSQAAMN